MTVRKFELRDETRLIGCETGVVRHRFELRQGVLQFGISRLGHFYGRLVQADGLGQEFFVAAETGEGDFSARIAEFGAGQEIREICATSHDGHQVGFPIEIPGWAGQRPELMPLTTIKDEPGDGRLLDLRSQRHGLTD
jgi:hypothetical protein